MLYVDWCARVDGLVFDVGCTRQAIVGIGPAVLRCGECSVRGGRGSHSLPAAWARCETAHYIVCMLGATLFTLTHVLEPTDDPPYPLSVASALREFVAFGLPTRWWHLAITDSVLPCQAQSPCPS